METYEHEPHVVHHVKHKPTMWKWYFCWHPRVLLTVPIFLLFAYQGIWFFITEIKDVIYFFHSMPVTWGKIFLVIIFGSFLLMLVLLPIYLCFASIEWLYEIVTGEHTAWKKFLYSTGIILLVFVGTSLIRMFTLWITGTL